MRRGYAALFAAGALLLLASCTSGGGGAPEGPTEPGLATRTVQAGAVEVKVEPVRIDEEGAELDLTFDTHSVELDLDVASAARLEVDGVEWGGARWNGDPPGGHHREGTLSFEAAGQARESARLVLEGLPEEVDVRWSLEGTG